jgi:hypothetical protein
VLVIVLKGQELTHLFLAERTFWDHDDDDVSPSAADDLDHSRIVIVGGHFGQTSDC